MRNEMTTGERNRSSSISSEQNIHLRDSFYPKGVRNIFPLILLKKLERRQLHDENLTLLFTLRLVFFTALPLGIMGIIYA